jgi:hypothetical protein
MSLQLTSKKVKETMSEKTVERKGRNARSGRYVDVDDDDDDDERTDS